MRRIVFVLAVLMCTVPVGVSLTGCGHKTSIEFCPGSSWIQLGQVTTLDLEPRYYGKTLAFGQIDSFATPTATDCMGTPQNPKITFSSSDQSIVDINPATGAICAGQWNRNSPNGVADYTTCAPGTVPGHAEIYAAGGGANSNRVVVYVHAPVAAITLGNPCTLSGTCATDPSTDFCPIVGSTPVTAPPYTGQTCISQKSAAQIVTRAYDSVGNNITCTVGHPSFNFVTSGLLTVDENGVATAVQPGSTVVTATISRNTSTAGLISVCPPASITLSTPNAVGNTVSINPNTTETLIADIRDAAGVQMTGLNLTYTSNTPTTVNATSNGILATFPSAASITAFCVPPQCNPAPTQSIGLFGNGMPVASNSILAKASGVSGTQMWLASTDSKYIVPVDYVLNSVGAPVSLPFAPNSMVITQSGANIYMGSTNELMTFSTSSNAVTAVDVTAQGKVLASAPDSTSIIITDPNRKTTSVYNPANSTIISSFGGVATRAQYSPDSRTVYITAATQEGAPPTLLFIYNTFTGSTIYDMSSTGANDVVVGIPSVGAFVGGNSAVVGRTYCSDDSVTPIVDYYPVASTVAVPAERLAATNDGNHILAAHVATGGGVPIINDLVGPLLTGTPLNGSCTPKPVFQQTPNTITVTGVNAAAVSEVVPSSDATISFLTYTAASGAATTGTLLPAYKPAASGPGTLSFATLADGATAPVAGVFSTNNATFYVGTSGDNQVHLIDPNTLTDTRQINPRLPSASGSGFATPNLIVQKPRATT